MNIATIAWDAILAVGTVVLWAMLGGRGILAVIVAFCVTVLFVVHLIELGDIQREHSELVRQRPFCGDTP